MANERALGVSFIHAVQTWRQLAAVAEPARLRQDPDHRLGRRRAPGGAEVGGLSRPTSDPRVIVASLTTGRINGVQDSSAIPANVTTQATTQLEAGVPFTSDSDPKAQLQKADVPPDQAGCASESQ